MNDFQHEDSAATPPPTYMATDPNFAIFDWIENEDALRDEAVLFGLSEGDIAQRVAVIDAYFQQHIVVAAQQQQYLEEKKTRLELSLSQQQNLLTQATASRQQLATQTPAAPSHKLRLAVGTVAYLLSAALGFTWVYEWLSPYWSQPVWVTAGMYAFGMFSLWSNTAMLYAEKSEQPTGWQKWAEEVGIPLVAAFFVVVWGLADRPALHSIAVLLATFFLFAYAGKGLLGNLARWASVLREENATKRNDQWRNVQLERLETEIGTYSAQVAGLQKDLEEIYLQLAEFVSPKSWQAKREVAVRLFESEAQLARATKQDNGGQMPKPFRSHFDFEAS
ncbi:hypothetical protein SAMN05421780_101805 [Flexibacter flexilis DSM 6793]|uniref:Uncharacterized protein n=1 Tax=Flexibacter flexilis DSM 6793 TaxID=927664 RepID=A0A1I1EHC3_9BACT|nr:hypothetical protein [Flexibacter flexilis]SFB86417.1 hypothetical protein SAMN05421780_101805 [Flexibacter flexilis DSM 6793]